MARITDREGLRERYKHPKGRSLTKQMAGFDKHSRRYIELSPFLVLATSGPGGGDASPRGEAPGFVQVLDDHTLAIPDRPGNNRLDSFQNLLDNPEVGIIFLIPGVNETLRVNGTAEIRDDEDLLARFEVNGRRPATVVVVHARDVYLHCAKALMRSGLWTDAARHDERPIPPMGQMVSEQTGDESPPETDEAMVERYKKAFY